ncbi:hypothetical protein [Cellulosilyticum sp. I15G10I2]|uniref:hypothetical protein n=1 Tax=Cellulosilyticum sp. I15G10I2 TaxID=1892843 RepID=UPI00085BBB7E|nr:hypothetical protein [Cellulosilyticum sp. I15G10I2]
MDRDQLLMIKDYLNARRKVLPEYVEQDPYHWNSRIYMAKLLQEIGNTQEAYIILRGIYEDNTFRFDKGIHGAYEEYIIEKVKFFQQLAQLSIEVTKEPAQSIPYLDEALIMLDGAESVYPYVDPKDIKLLKKSYLNRLD